MLREREVAFRRQLMQPLKTSGDGTAIVSNPVGLMIRSRRIYLRVNSIGNVTGR